MFNLNLYLFYMLHWWYASKQRVLVSHFVGADLSGGDALNRSTGMVSTQSADQLRIVDAKGGSSRTNQRVQRHGLFLLHHCHHRVPLAFRLAQKQTPSSGLRVCPSLISRTVSVDVKHHFYWFTREPVWPSGKALGWEAEGPRFDSASAVHSLQKVVVCGLCLVTLSFTINY